MNSPNPSKQSTGDPGMQSRRVPPRIALIPYIVAIAFFMQTLDSAIINTSLPQMAVAFGVRPLDLSIGVTAYVGALAALIPMSGWTADRYGARTVFCWAIVVFTLASLGCGLSRNLWMFAGFRLAQGVGGALMTPVGRIVVLRAVSKPDLLRATSLITWPALIAPVIGPVLGGALTTYASWRWNFLLNVPVGSFGLLCVAWFIPNYRSEEKRRFDSLGFVLTSVSLTALICGLEGIVTAKALLVPLTLLVIGLGFGWAAYKHMLHVPAPLLDLSSLKVFTFASSTIGTGLAAKIALNATPFLLPLLFQVGFGRSASAAGLLIFVYFLGNLLMKLFTTPALRMFGFRQLLVGNGIASGATIIACGFLSPATPAFLIMTTLFLTGMTRSLHFTALSTIAFADTEERQASSASTLSGMAVQISVVIGIAISGMLLNMFRNTREGSFLTLTDFQNSLIIIGLISISSALFFLRLETHAGHEVSGRPPKT